MGWRNGQAYRVGRAGRCADAAREALNRRPRYAGRTADKKGTRINFKNGTHQDVKELVAQVAKN